MEGADRRSTVARGDARHIEDRANVGALSHIMFKYHRVAGLLRSPRPAYILYFIKSGRWRLVNVPYIFRKRFTFIIHSKHHTHSVHLRIVMI